MFEYLVKVFIVFCEKLWYLMLLYILLSICVVFLVVFFLFICDLVGFK